jgi:Response regulator containing a CheY-like receiver domain and an HTH DNA-binding domain
MRRITVVIADRHPIVLQGISSVLATQHDFAIVASCGNGASCMEAVRLFTPDIVLLEVAIPDISGPEVLALTNSAGLGTRVVFFTSLAKDRELAKLATAGAHAVLSKDAKPEMLVEALRQVAQGQKLLSLPPTSQDISQGLPAAEEKSLTQLTDRERQIMRLVSEGLTNKEIGRRLNIADGTIKVHLHHIFQKLDISNRTVLAALAISQNELRVAPHEVGPPDLLQRDPASAK